MDEDERQYRERQVRAIANERAKWEALRAALRAAAELVDDQMWFLGDGHGGAVVLEFWRALEERGFLPAPPPSESGRSRPKTGASLQLEVYRRDGFKCAHCGTSNDLTVDHIVPVSRGGSHELDNMQTLCGPCNSRKGAA